MTCDFFWAHRHLAKTSYFAVCLCALAIVPATCSIAIGAGETPDSPNVQKVVKSALTYLESHTDDHLGGKCLIGLAFLKAGKPDHPRVREAVDECVKQARTNLDESSLDMYSNGLAIIFLCEVSAQKHAREIEFYLGKLKARQKKEGGWGYKDNA